MRGLPTGTVTLLFTDIEGSTGCSENWEPTTRPRWGSIAARWEERSRDTRVSRWIHRADDFFVAFPSATQAVTAAAASQDALEGGPIRVRIGVHTGEPSLTEEGYIGLDVHKGARIAASGHGGQVIVSADTRALLDDTVTLIDDR